MTSRDRNVSPEEEARISTIESAVKDMQAKMLAFQDQYEVALKEIVEQKARRSKLMNVALEELVKKGVWAALAVLAAAFLISMRHYLRTLLS